MKKKSMENWNVIKNGHSEDYAFDTSEPRNINSLTFWEVYNFYYETITLKVILKRKASAKIKPCGYF